MTSSLSRQGLYSYFVLTQKLARTHRGRSFSPYSAPMNAARVKKGRVGFQRRTRTQPASAGFRGHTIGRQRNQRKYSTNSARYGHVVSESAKRARTMANIETGDELSIRVLPTGRVRTEWRKARYTRPSGLVLFAANESNSARFARLDASKLRSCPSSMGDALTRFRLRAKKSKRASEAAR
jgi:hypothetical protein